MRIKPQVLAPLLALSLAASKGALAQAAPKAQAAPGGGAWKLVWADEFSVDGAPDARSWSFERGLVRNEEEQWYQPQNARCKSGILSIQARREATPNPDFEAGSADWRKRPSSAYTSASLSTNGLRSWRCGRFEMRARIDTRLGLWPAFWTVGQRGEWPLGGEIDIMEFYQGHLLANVAWGSGRRWQARWDSARTPLADLGGPEWSRRFHVWRMDWDEASIRLSVDDRLLNETLLKDTINGGAQGLNPFLQPHFIILNLAVGGQNGGDASATAFPASFEIDYVRVYQTEAQIQAQAQQERAERSAQAAKK